VSTHPARIPHDSPPPPEKILTFEDLLAALDDPSRYDRALLERAWVFSRDNHKGQNRLSGNPYIHHCLAVAIVLAELHLDTVTIAAGLLHDIVEDTDHTMESIAKEFGPEIAGIVDGVTKVGGFEFNSPAEQHAETWRKMLLSIARDVRVILIKLADRLHNMRTLHFLREDKRHRIARETLEIYAPLAHRFGIAAIRWELEDQALKHLEPEAYASLVDKVVARRDERQAYLERLTESLQEMFEKAGIKPDDIAGRPKHFYSIYNKMKKRGKEFDEIYDLLAVRVIVPTPTDCYEVLGIIHGLWTPVPDRIKDFIANPKSNHYRSLHTTVIGPDHEWVEFQIRTPEMHREAEYGIAAHWAYKEGVTGAPEAMARFPWIGDLVKEQADQGAEEFLDLLKSDLFQDEVFVFTPRGELKVLPKGGTPIDFAYLVHTEVGHHCVGARVNGKIVPLRSTLRNGDTVEVITSPMGKPSQDWLKVVRTSSARGKIRRHFRLEQMQHSISLGKEMLEREAKRHRVDADAALDRKFAESLGFDSVEKLRAAVGQGDLSAVHVIRRLFPELADSSKEPSGLRRILTFTRRREGGVRVQGLSNVMIRFAQCCQPVPGESIVGIVTTGRGISVHRIDCPSTFPEKDGVDRRVSVDWDVAQDTHFRVRILVGGENRAGLLADLSAAITEAETNILSATMEADGYRATGTFLVEVLDLHHLRLAIEVMRKVKGVTDVVREDQNPEHL
jgi:GTP pyrophosphokinase